MQPLRTAAVEAARRACMAVSDNALFQRLYGQFEEFASVTNTDEMLLGGSAAKDRDRIIIQELHSNDGAFVAHVKLVQFRLRMRLSKRICVEFVTLGKRDLSLLLSYLGLIQYREACAYAFFNFVTTRPAMAPDILGQFVGGREQVACVRGQLAMACHSTTR